MFQAILHGKVRNNILGFQLGSQWRDMYRKTEDFLTASVFTRLTYLPPQNLWSIIRRAVAKGISTSQSLFVDVGGLQTREFWPRWTLDHPERVVRTKEPDVFLEFEQLYLIVEAKADDGPRQQSPSQWAAEIASCIQSNDLVRSKPLWLFAIGGLGEEIPQADFEKMSKEAERLLHEEHKFHDDHVSVAACSWRQLLSALIEESKGIDDTASGRVLADIIEILRFHGFRHVNWLDEFRSLQIEMLLPISDSSLTLLEQWVEKKTSVKNLEHLPWYFAPGLLGIREESELTLGGILDGT